MGVFPLTQGSIHRSDRGWRPKDSSLLLPHACKVEKDISTWNMFHISEAEGHEALMHFSVWLISQGHNRRAAQVLKTALRGDFWSATAAESLALAQHLWAKDPAAKLQLAHIWWKQFGSGQ